MYWVILAPQLTAIMENHMSDATLLKSYLDGWAMICNSTPESVEAMVGGAHPDIRFCDVNAPNVHVGHDGIRSICRLATSLHSGATLAYRDLLFDRRNWAIRWTLSGARPDGTHFNCRGASAGILADDGRVIEHTDYWNRAELLAGN
jgi:hypothetical protein